MTGTDDEVIGQIKSGDTSSFSVLVWRYQKVLLRICLRMVGELSTAEDIVQDTFIKAFQALQGFEGRSSFKTWLIQIAVNTAKNKLRSGQRNRRTESLDENSWEFAVESDTERNLDERDLEGLIREEVERLPLKQKTAVCLRVYEDLSFKEIAVVMSCPYDTAKANYRHGLLKLRNRLIEEGLLVDMGFDLASLKKHSEKKVYEA